MISKMREKCKNKKGFTLVELIVVLVILAILIALLVPTLTGYIDKANEKKVLAEAKLGLNAAQLKETDVYSQTSETTGYTGTGDKGFDVFANKADKGKGQDVWELYEAKDSVTIFKYVSDGTGKITSLTFGNAKYTATYNDKGEWSTGKTTTP